MFFRSLRPDKRSACGSAHFLRFAYYDTKPKQEIKAREIGPDQETEMKGSSVEDYRTIGLDVKCHADHDKATPEAGYSTDKKLRTNLSSRLLYTLL